jgi:capsular exopolysaccharide synthesis family protein
MELRRYFYPLIRWWWLLLTATLVAGLFSFLATLQQPPVYESSTTLMIGRAIENPNPDSNEFWLSQQLAETYADIAKRDMVREGTMSALGLDFLPQYDAHALPNSQLIEIVVADTVPQRAQAVATELANQLIQRSPTGAQQAQSQQAFISEQLEDIRVQIDSTKEEIRIKQEELGSMDSARQITDTQNQITALQAKLSSLQDNYANLYSITSQGAVNTLSVIEPAGLPVNPVGPGRMISVLMAAAIGLVLAAVAAYLIEYLDDTIRRPEDVKRVFDVPTLGYISDMDIDEDGEENVDGGLYVAGRPRHPVVDAYRSLRTNLEFASVDQPLRTLLISSSDAQVGKTSLACNLAVVMAQGEKRVILLDADLRRPKVHHYFKLPNQVGLSDIFLNRASIEETLKDYKDKNLRIIPAGVTPPNPTELVSSKKMVQVLNRLAELADIVIVDGPPFVVADAAVLSARVDGLLLIVRPGMTREASARAMMEQVQRAGARVVGLALTRLRGKQAAYFGAGSYTSSYYYASEDMTDRHTKKTSRSLGLGRVLPKNPLNLGNGTRNASERRKDISMIEAREKRSD